MEAPKTPYQLCTPSWDILKTPKRGLLYKTHGHLEASEYTDIDLVSSLSDRRSIIGIIYMLGITLIHGKGLNNIKCLCKISKLI